MKRLLAVVVFCIIISVAFAQNEFYNNGSLVYVNSKTSTTVASLRVNGSITNNNGSFTNNTGLIELTGNWTNTSSSNYYISTGMERFTDTFNQTINGVWNGTTSNQNQFYDLKINKPQARGQYINLNTNTNVNSNGSLEFESANGIIRTDVSSHTSNGSLYPYELFLRNPVPAKLIGNSWATVSQFSNTGGATTKYIEGKLRRAVSSYNSYNFPIGVTPTSLDGMEGVSIAFSPSVSFTTTDVLAYIQPAATPAYTSDLIANGQVLFYDIGSLPAVAPANQFQQCVGGPDGKDDVAIIDAAISHEWILTSTAATSTYDLSVHPGSVLDNLSYVQMRSPCSSPYPKTKYIARNGRIGGDEATGPSTNYWVPGVQGLYQKPNGNLLSGQTGFSRFRIFGTTDTVHTSLPVELVYLRANAVDNEYIKIDWETASEINNKGFTVLRSTDGYSFDSIAWINGNGTTSYVHDYVYDDRNVQKEMTYYYKLKQVDNNNAYQYTRMVSARLNGSKEQTITLYPNPSNTNTTLHILSLSNDEYAIHVYDAIGRLLYSDVIQAKANATSLISLPSNEWAKGIYMVKVRSSNGNDIQGMRFVKE